MGPVYSCFLTQTVGPVVGSGLASSVEFLALVAGHVVRRCKSMRFLDSKTDVDRAMQQCMRFSNLDTLEKQVTEWQEGVVLVKHHHSLVSCHCHWNWNWNYSNLFV